jgi:hypothetical protein
MRKITSAFLLCFIAFNVGAESLEERIEVLEEKVQTLTELAEEVMQELSLRDNSSVKDTDSQNGRIPDSGPSPTEASVAEGEDAVTAPPFAEERNSENVVSAMLFDLTFHESNSANDYANDYSDWLSIGFYFLSNLEKTTRAIKGTVVFYDLFDEEWWRVRLTLSDPLVPNELLGWSGSVNYNQFQDGHRTAKNTKPEDILVVFEVSQIIYEDGEKERFE